MGKSLPEYILIGVVKKAHGVKGLMKVKPMTDHPSRYKELKTVMLESQDGQHHELDVTHVSIGEHEVRLGLHGVVTRDAAEQLQGSSILISRENALPLEEDRYYHFEIIGFKVVTVTGVYLGEVKEVLDLPANAVIVVNDGSKELLIPSVRDVIKKIDKEKGQIIIEPLEGLLD